MARRDTRNPTKYWCSNRIAGMSLLRADFTTHDYGPHTHNAFVIAVTEAGGAEINSARGADKVSPSILFISNPEERQSARMGESRRWVYRSIYLTPEATEAVSRRLGIKTAPFFTRSLLADADLIDRFTALHHALETEDDGFRADELLIDAFEALFRRHGSGGSRPERPPQDRMIADKVLELMRARYDEPLELDELAHVVGLTSFQLIGLFKRAVGLTPHAHLIHIRLSAACRLLKQGISLAESAQASGFCDQSALTKHFKRCYGITPLQFAEAVRAS